MCFKIGFSWKNYVSPGIRNVLRRAARLHAGAVSTQNCSGRIRKSTYKKFLFYIFVDHIPFFSQKPQNLRHAACLFPALLVQRCDIISYGERAMKKALLRTFVATTMAFAFCTTFSALAADKELINGIDANYPPFAYVDESGKPSGFDVDSMDWIAKTMGFTVTHKPMDWDGIISALLAKKIDMVCSGMSISPERLQRVTFTEPYWIVRKVFLAKNNSNLTMEQIRNGSKRLGVQRGTNEAELLQQELGKKTANYTLRFYDSGPLGVEDLLNGRIDAFALDSAPANDAIGKGKGVKVIGDLGVEDDFAVATRNEDADLRTILNEGYKKLMADPYWQKLQTKYLK